jgi:RimJ/RimL family protein N-acetyltransferase
VTSPSNVIPPTILTAPGLVLRPFRDADEQAVGAALRDPDILRWATGTAIANAPETERAAMWLKLRIDGWLIGSPVFAIVEAQGTPTSETRLDPAKGPGTLLGAISVREINRLPGQAIVGYWVTAQSRGRAVASRALDAAARWAFSPTSEGGLGLYRLTLDHAVTNPASCRVALKSGFRLEGTMRAFFADPSGERHDSHLHARLVVDE